MSKKPRASEAAPYYFTYINRISTSDVVEYLGTQLDEMIPFLRKISDEKSLHRYAPEKWSIRQVWGHVNDAERVFLYRAFWFARKMGEPLPSFEQEISAASSHADDFSWGSHIEEFREIRLATLGFFRNMPADSWKQTGVASGKTFTVNALAYIIAGHAAHHRAGIEEHYL